MKPIIVPFTDELIPQAAAMLAGNHAAHRAVHPTLPPRFESPETASKAVETVWCRRGSAGYAALSGGELRAYLIGETTVQPWGRSGYVYLPGLGLEDGEDPRVLQDLYARLGQEWILRGCFNHYAYVSSAEPEVIDAWYALGFGRQRVDALLDLRTLEVPRYEVPPGIEIRLASRDDKRHLAGIATTIAKQLASAPRWHPMLPEEADELREGWAELVDDQTVFVWLALEGDRTVGSIAFWLKSEADDDLTVPPVCTYLSVSATLPAARGRGIGTALTWHGLSESRRNGFDTCLTDWQSANLLAARFWPRFGFKPVAYRLARIVNPMIAWADGHEQSRPQ